MYICPHQMPRVLRFNWIIGVMGWLLAKGLSEKVVEPPLRGSIQVQRCARSLFGWPWPWGDKEKRNAKRRKIEAERGQGYIAELQEFRENKGKKFKAMADLLPKYKSITFPKFTKSALDGSLVTLPLPTTSLVLLHFRSLGQKMCGKYRKQFEAEFGDTVAMVELTLLDTWAFAYAQRWIEQDLCKSIPAKKQGFYLVLIGDVVRTLRACLGMHSGIVGYAFLLDNEGLIRWQAHAEPTRSELQAMIECTRKLINSKTKN